MRNGLVDVIGSTPLIRINSLSEATGCKILGKCEFLKPRCSVEDRVAVKIIQEKLISSAWLRRLAEEANELASERRI